MTTTSRANLRDQVISELRGIGSDFGGGRLLPPPGDPKLVARQLYQHQRLEVPADSGDFIYQWKTASSAGSPVAPRWIRVIRPEIRPVSSEEDGAAFRFASLHGAPHRSRRATATGHGS